KAGIIKPNTPVVIGEHQPEIAIVFENKASENNTELTFASNEWCHDTSKLIDGKREISIHGKQRSLELKLDLTGTYQLKNVKTVLTAVDQLKEKGFSISDDQLASALSEVKKLTG